MWNFRTVRFRSTDSPELMAQAWRLRHRVFRENLGWDVPSVDLLEFDCFDRDAWHCGVVSGDRLLGYLRALCTLNPYLLERNFPALLNGHAAPRSKKIWEISRFAVSPDEPRRRQIGRMLIREGIAFGQDVGASQLIAVTDIAFERFMVGAGVPISRTGGPLRVGRGHSGDVEAVLITLDLSPARSIPTPIAVEAA